MAATYEPIASQTLGSDSATITFSSIASGYTDLLLIVVAPSMSGANADTLLGARFNSDTGSNYSETFLVGSGAVTVSSRDSNLTRYSYGYQTAQANQFVAKFHIMSYANTNVYKTVLTEYAEPSGRVERNVGLWRSTSAISAIQLLTMNSMSYASGTTASLFGIKAA